MILKRKQKAEDVIATEPHLPNPPFLPFFFFFSPRPQNPWQIGFSHNLQLYSLFIVVPSLWEYDGTLKASITLIITISSLFLSLYLYMLYARPICRSW